MSEPNNPSLHSALAFSIPVMLGLILGGWILGAQVKAMKLADRYVTVKGLVERTVKSDTAMWPVSFKEAGNDLPSVFSKSEADKARILAFFKDQGFSSDDMTIGQIQVTDTQTNEYNAERAPSRYIVQQTVTVHTTDVDKLAKAGEKTATLVQAGIVLAGNSPGAGAAGITYKFTGLNALKPDMITEATRNARASADRFAADSGSQVGSIRSANQGVFSISAAGVGTASPTDDDASGGDQADASIMKKVRVVSTIDYYLIK
ncbi:SIMPL domain-containing protein [Granulicella arctica]|uniref:SIMPL domain-containing protein n=1 Tax=Granulicella arctica TaxID=940613 RepID=A0A7Y9TUP8_9BACT|nr:SIMPL domain-containing protein [Granulicella arctica]NYF81073.1 hypothetical protein [Granulicella arctica]